MAIIVGFGSLQFEISLNYQTERWCSITHTHVDGVQVVQFSSIGATLTSVWQNIRFTRRLKYSQHVSIAAVVYRL